MENAQLPIVKSRRTESAREIADPAIAAAFLAFHRNAGLVAPPVRRQRSAMASGVWAFLALSVLGFGGGLFLAIFCFNNPEQTIKVTAVAPELIYARPGGEIPATAAGGAPIAQNGSDVEESAPAAPAEPALAENEPLSIHRSADSEPELSAEKWIAQAALPEATANFAAAQRLGLLGGPANHNGGNGDAFSSYDAVELPTIPEPSSGGLIAFGVAVLVAHRSRKPRTRNAR